MQHVLNLNFWLFLTLPGSGAKHRLLTIKMCWHPLPEQQKTNIITNRAQRTKRKLPHRKVLSCQIYYFGSGISKTKLKREKYFKVFFPNPEINFLILCDSCLHPFPVRGSERKLFWQFCSGPVWWGQEQVLLNFRISNVQPPEVVLMVDTLVDRI